MARPSRKAERREEILDAFERCVARFGVEGATLERTAEEAGLARALIRHNAGNRDQLLTAMTARFLERTRQRTEEMAAALPHENRLEVLIDWLFDPAASAEGSGREQDGSTHVVLVSEALIAASLSDPELAAKMRGWSAHFIGMLEKVAASACPNAPQGLVTAAAAGITGIYFNVESLRALGGIQTLAASSKRAALLLAASLEQSEREAS